MYKPFGRERVKVWQSINILTKEYIICIAPVPSTPSLPTTMIPIIIITFILAWNEGRDTSTGMAHGVVNYVNKNLLNNSYFICYNMYIT